MQCAGSRQPPGLISVQLVTAFFPRSIQARPGSHPTMVCKGTSIPCVRRLYAMPVALSLTGGFIMAAISPTVMVTGMLELQRRGYGQDKSADLGCRAIGLRVQYACCPFSPRPRP